VADSDSVKGKVNEGMGAVKEKAGQVTGDHRIEAEGNEQKNEGKLQNAWGQTKDAARDAVDAAKDTVDH